LAFGFGSSGPTEAKTSSAIFRALSVPNWLTSVSATSIRLWSRSLTLRLLEQAEGLFDDLAELGRETPQLRHRKAEMLIASSRNYAMLGDTAKQLVRIAEARRLLVNLATESPTRKVISLSSP
jgi:hypothetical protein